MIFNGDLANFASKKLIFIRHEIPFFFLFNFIFLSRMAQPAELTLGQAAKNVEDRIAELERKAGGDDDIYKQSVADDAPLKALQALFEGLKLQGFLSLFFFFFFPSFFFPALISNFISMFRPPSTCSFPRIGPVLAIYAKHCRNRECRRHSRFWSCSHHGAD